MKAPVKRSQVAKRTDRGNNYSKLTTAHLTAILSDPYTRGVDGQDYGPVRHELEQELWKRQSNSHESILAQYERDQREYLKHLATSHKRKKASA